MPTVTLVPSGKKVDVSSGISLFDAAGKAGLPVASSCSAENICGKCNMRIILGAGNLSPRSELEVGLLRREKNPLTDRISCLTQVLGDCTVTTRYW